MQLPGGRIKTTAPLTGRYLRALASFGECIGCNLSCVAASFFRPGNTTPGMVMGGWAGGD